jgi:hypothetical protein
MEQAPGAPKQRSPWFYVLLGCGGLALLSCLVMSAIALFSVKMAKDVASGAIDPAKRDENARAFLGAVPAGYTPQMAINLLGQMGLVMLSDGEPDADGGVGEGTHEFMYMRLASSEQNQKSKAFFTSNSTDASQLSNANGVKLDLKQVLKRGSLTIAGKKIWYVAGRGTVNNGQGGGRNREGLTNALYFECPTDVLRMGFWFQADPNPATAAEQLDLTGTVADEAELTRLLAGMNPCAN